MIYGLTPNEFQLLRNHLIEPLKFLGAEVYIFGSRARGTHSKFSDVDLLYTVKEGGRISPSQIHHMLSVMEDSDFPYHIDLVRLEELAPSYKENILKDKVAL